MQNYYMQMQFNLGEPYTLYTLARKRPPEAGLQAIATVNSSIQPYTLGWSCHDLTHVSHANMSGFRQRLLWRHAQLVWQLIALKGPRPVVHRHPQSPAMMKEEHWQ